MVPFSFFFNLEINLTFLLNIVFEHYKVKAEWREKKERKAKGLNDHLINQQCDYQVGKGSLGQNPTSLVTVSWSSLYINFSSFTRRKLSTPSLETGDIHLFLVEVPSLPATSTSTGGFFGQNLRWVHNWAHKHALELPLSLFLVIKQLWVIFKNSIISPG